MLRAFILALWVVGYASAPTIAGVYKSRKDCLKALATAKEDKKIRGECEPA